MHMDRSRHDLAQTPQTNRLTKTVYSCQTVSAEGIPNEHQRFTNTHRQTSVIVRQYAGGIPNKHQDRQHKDGNLDGGSKSHSNGEVHLVLVGHQHSGDMLTGVASNGQDDETQEGLTESRLLTHIRNGVCQESADTEDWCYQKEASDQKVQMQQQCICHKSCLLCTAVQQHLSGCDDTDTSVNTAMPEASKPKWSERCYWTAALMLQDTKPRHA